MKNKKDTKKLFLAIIPMWMAMTITGCLSQEDVTTGLASVTVAGPIDGNWNITAFECSNGNSMTAPTGASMTMLIANAGGAFTMTEGSCSRTQAMGYAYAGNSVTLTHKTSVTCSAGCGPCDQPQAEDSSTFSYALSGANLVFTHQITPQDSEDIAPSELNCGVGDTITVRAIRL